MFYQLLTRCSFLITCAQLNSNLRKAPLCYDEVRVCSFCSQLFARQQDTYRPSWEAKEAEKIRVKDELESKQRKAFWDPLTTTEMERAEEMKEMKERLSRGPEVVSAVAEPVESNNEAELRTNSRKSLSSSK